MRSFIVIVIAFLFVENVWAQDSATGVEKKITKINAFYPSFEQERKVSQETTWGYRAGFNIFFEYGSSYVFANYNQIAQVKVRYFEFIPTAEIYYRWYYRLLKRQNKGRKTANNSSAYLFAGAGVMAPGIKVQSQYNDGLNDVLSGIYAGWGFRRTLGQKIILDLNIRYSILMLNVEEVNFANIIPGFRLGYRIN